MSEHYPRIRVHAESGYLLVREGLRLCFYMPRYSHELVQGVMKSLEAYVRAVGPQALGIYADDEGEWQPLDEEGWALTRGQLLGNQRLSIHLSDESTRENRYDFVYRGKPFNSPLAHLWPGQLSAVQFWLPTEYLEEHGPERVRALALELAAPLPLCFGHAGLAFNADLDLLGVLEQVLQRCFRYPGLDVIDFEHVTLNLGTRVRASSWLTFLGQPVLGELGGATGLRQRLHAPDTTVEALDGERALVTLGPWPEAGDTQAGHTLPAYRELARVLEPWLYREERPYTLRSEAEAMRRWERRFLD